MLRINYEHRGFPGKMQNSKYTIDEAVKNYYQEIKIFYDELKTTDQLESIEYKGLDREAIGFWEERYKLLGTEARGVLISKTHVYNYKLGELIYMDGFWKSFTLPRD
jgi:hypothetical protein